MKHEQEVKDLLIRNAIHLIAIGGFEKATTKELTHNGGSLPDFRMNEVYIYRLFGSKENLYEQAFILLDRELFSTFRAGARAVGGFQEHTKEKLYDFFLLAWQFVSGNEERCRTYVRYYYSVYFKGHSKEAHSEIFADMVERMTPLFAEGADVVSILHSVFTAVLDFAIRVYNLDLEDNEPNRRHMFNVLYCMVATYLKSPATSPKGGET